MTRSIHVGLALSLLLCSCVTMPRVGVFAPGAYFLTRDHYRVSYITGGTDVMAPDWSLENFQLTETGIGPAKWTRDFTRSLELDANDDGRPESRFVVERYDLRYSHRTDGTVLWAQTTPVPARGADRSLDVVAHDFVDRVGGSSYFEVDWTTDTVTERRYATTIRAEGPAAVDTVPAYWVTFDLVSLDQRELDPTHVGEQVTVVIVRPSARWHPTPGGYDADRSGGWPMLVTFGYASRAEHHDAHRAEFEEFLRRVDFHETP